MFESIGLFWKEEDKKKKNPLNRPMPDIPKTDWHKPAYFPNLESATVISLDTETYDPELIDQGPGWARGVGHIIGVSIGCSDKHGNTGRWYFPMRHETMPEDNVDPEKVLAWLRVELSRPHQPKIGANLPYDIGWLKHEGVEVAGELVDVQYAEALLDESAPVALESLAQKYLNEGKESNLLYQWLADWFGGEPNGEQRKWMYKAPPCLAGPYAESDADLPLKLAGVMYPLLVNDGLLDLFYMECKLIRLMIDMRFAGVSVDLAKAEELRETLEHRKNKEEARIAEIAGQPINVDSSGDLQILFDKLGLSYPLTDKGNPSFTKKFIETIDHDVGTIIREIKKCRILKNTFVESYILNSHVNGKVYCQFHQLRNDEGGTRSGRFSSSTPNLQNIPSNDKELAPLIRGLFIPDEGHVAWRKYDYSQIEYRMLIHYAIGEPGDAIRAYFKANPDTDYHVYAQETVQAATGILIDRKPIKNINFGLIYGMGVPKLAASLGMTVEEAQALMAAYFQGVPFAKPTMDYCSKFANDHGYISTILGRRSQFDLWEPATWGVQGPALGYNRAINTYGNIRRAYTHKALNRKLQGSAADLMKMAMLKCYESGVFDYIGVPRLTVHDELDFSDPGGVDDGFREMCHIMETALPQLNVPVKADGEIGPDWGHVKDI